MINEKTERIKYLVAFLNKCAEEYYNFNSPSLSDAEYDALFDELTELEKETGVILANSPTQKVGYTVVDGLQKVTHSIPLLSLAKTKDVDDVLKMSQKQNGCLTLKIDGLTVKLVYNNGELVEASTRGDGNEGEIITHNAKVFTNIPLKLPQNINITVTGEAYIDIDNFNQINESIENDEDKYSTPRNLAAGSVRQLDSTVCAKRGVKFFPFNVIEGMEEIPLKSERLTKLKDFGFDLIPLIKLTTNSDYNFIETAINGLKEKAFEMMLPIDGIVFSYDDIKFSASLGKTSHHFRDGIAYKFGDPFFKTILKEIEWNISRTGQLTPVAIFKPVEIDNTIVERASLHNISFIENLKLLIGDEILVSKRNMIIPHVEENLSNTGRETYKCEYPALCPVCEEKTVVETTKSNDKNVAVLYCNNDNCPGKQIKKFTHFVSKQAINIDGLSEQILSKFINKGYIKTLSDIFNLKDYYNEICELEGFGVKSATNLIQSIEAAKNTPFANFLVALNIDLIGKNYALLLENHFSSNLNTFLEAATSDYDFTQINGFGEMINNSIHEWFNNDDNLNEFNEIKSYLNIEVKENNVDTNSIFYQKTVVITGSFDKYTRDELSDLLRDLGAKVTSSVSKNTDYLICGENAGSKLDKAKALNVQIITAEQLPF